MNALCQLAKNIIRRNVTDKNVDGSVQELQLA